MLRLPFLETEITINFADGESAEQLIQASPDLHDLELASAGKLLPLLRQVFLTSLPLETKALLAGSTGQPLLEQALHAATQVVSLEGVELDDSGRMLTEALIRAERRGQPNILGFLRELPGEQASIDLSRLAEVANRLKTNLEEGVALARSVEAASVTATPGEPPPRFSWPVVSQLIDNSNPVATTSRIRSATSAGCSSAVGFRG